MSLKSIVNLRKIHTQILIMLNEKNALKDVSSTSTKNMRWSYNIKLIQLQIL